MNNQNYVVGNVISIEGTKIKILMRENTNAFSLFYNGVKYNGVSINEYVGVIRGPYTIIVKIDKEFLYDKSNETNNQTYQLDRFQRELEASIVGCFFKEEFEFGLKYFPMIFNEVILLSSNEKDKIYKKLINRNMDDGYTIKIGETLKDSVSLNLDIDGLFNTHLGILGNTGSGKSNTLTKLYTELFRHKRLNALGVSKFQFLDFNGEYVGKDLFVEDEYKSVINLDTKKGKDKILINKNKFWDEEVLSVLFSATDKTQKTIYKECS